MNLESTTTAGAPRAESQLLRMARVAAREAMTRHGLWMIARWVVLAIASIAAAISIPDPWMRAVALVAISGVLQRWITSGVLHEATHGTLPRNRRANDELGRFFAGLALVDWTAFRGKHLKHHRDLATSRDPERVDMEAYGFDVRGMGFVQIAAMLARPFTPAKLALQARATLKAFGRNPVPMLVAIAMLAPFAMFDATLLIIPAAWFAASASVRVALWLAANATEHDFVLGDELERGSTERARALLALPKEIQWLAVSRERRGLAFLVLTPESERLWHGDHHGEGSIPGGSLRSFTAERLRFDALYREQRRVTHGLFLGRGGFESAFGALMAAKRRRRG